MTCSHSNCFRGLCVDCGMEILLNEQSLRADYISPLHQDRGLLIKVSEAHDIEIRERNELVQVHHKLNLIIDLDQTILHTTIKFIPSISEINSQSSSTVSLPLSSSNSSSIIDQVEKDNLHIMTLEETPGLTYTIKFRPFLREFLNSLDKLYKLHVYTMGSRGYARKITKIIDPKEKLFGDRIVSRDDVGGNLLGFDIIYNKKDIKRIFPCDDKTVLIVDDRADIWSWSPNLIPIAPFVYFSDSLDMNEIHGKHEKMEMESERKRLSTLPENLFLSNTLSIKIEEKLIKEENNKEKIDGELLKIQKILEEIHANYFKLLGEHNDDGNDSITASNEMDDHDNYENGNGNEETEMKMEKQRKRKREMNIPDIKVIVMERKALIFKGLHFVFSGIVPLSQRPQESEIWKLAQVYGAKCHENIHSNTTHLISDRRDTDKILKAQKKDKSIKIVKLKWFFTSIAYWERQKESDYLLMPLLKEKSRNSNQNGNDQNGNEDDNFTNDSNDDSGDSNSDSDNEPDQKKSKRNIENRKMSPSSLDSESSSSSISSLDDFAKDVESFF